MSYSDEIPDHLWIPIPTVDGGGNYTMHRTPLWNYLKQVYFDSDTVEFLKDINRDSNWNIARVGVRHVITPDVSYYATTCFSTYSILNHLIITRYIFSDPGINDQNILLHSDNTPSIEVTRHGDTIVEIWSHQGRFHRVGGPAILIRALSGKVLMEQWFHHGIPHRNRKYSHDFLKHSYEPEGLILRRHRHWFHHGVPNVVTNSNEERIWMKDRDTIGRFSEDAFQDWATRYEVTHYGPGYDLGHFGSKADYVLFHSEFLKKYNPHLGYKEQTYG